MNDDNFEIIGPDEDYEGNPLKEDTILDHKLRAAAHNSGHELSVEECDIIALYPLLTKQHDSQESLIKEMTKAGIPDYQQGMIVSLYQRTRTYKNEETA